MDASKSDSEHVWEYEYDKTIDTIDEILYWLSLDVPCWVHFDHHLMVSVFGNGPFLQPARVTRVTHDNYVCFEGWHDSKVCGFPIGMQGMCVKLGYSDFHNQRQQAEEAARCWTITADDVNRMVYESDHVSLIDTFPEFETREHRSENQSSVLIDHLRTRLSCCEDRVKRLEDELSRIKEKQSDIGIAGLVGVCIALIYACTSVFCLIYGIDI